MATCAVQNQARICVAGSLWGLCNEPVYPDGLIVRTRLVAPNGGLLIDAAGQCSDIALDEFLVDSLVVDTDGCWRTCALVPNIGTTSGEFIEPGNTSYVVEVLDALTSTVLYESQPFVIDADQIGTYPVDGNGCVQLCVLSPPATATPSNPFCEAVAQCETPWVFTADPLGILLITPGDNIAGAAGNGHAPAFGIDGPALCAYVTANCGETTFAGVDGFGIAFTAGGTAGHTPTVDFVPSVDAGQAIVASAGDGQPYVGNASLVETAPNSGTVSFTNNVGAVNVLDICQIVADAACAGGNVSVVTETIIPGAISGVGEHSIIHDDGAGVLSVWDVVSPQVGNMIAVGALPNGGSFFQLVAGTGVTITPGGTAGEFAISAAQPSCASIQALFPDGARRMAAADLVLVDDGAGGCEKVSPSVRSVRSQSYDEYCTAPLCAPPLAVLRPGVITGLGVAAASVPVGGGELWTIAVNGVPSAAAITLAAATNVATVTGLTVPVAAGDILTIEATGPIPATPSTCGTVTVEIAEAL